MLPWGCLFVCSHSNNVYIIFGYLATAQSRGAVYDVIYIRVQSTPFLRMFRNLHEALGMDIRLGHGRAAAEVVSLH